MPRSEVKSEIAGTVLRVKCKPGDRVDSGDTLVVIESMRMEIPVIAKDPGTVKDVMVDENDHVVEGQVIATLDH